MAFGGAYLIRPPKVYRWLYRKAIFRLSNREKTVYLTFDDGPHPEVTPAVLDILRGHQVKATFFVLGKNVLEHPELIQDMKAQGHVVANHGMNHLNGWQTDTETYVNDALEGKKITGSSLFRPAYGKLTLGQYNRLRKTETIVFWDVISGDFDHQIDEQRVISNVLKNVENGSVIVMHDSKKAMNNLIGSLNEIIVKLKQEGFCFGTLSASLEP